MDNGQPLEETANTNSRLRRIGQWALSEAKLFPYEAAAFVVGGIPGYFPGSAAGREFSQRAEAPVINFIPPNPDTFVQDQLNNPLNYEVGRVLGRLHQDIEYSMIGGGIGVFVFGLAAAVGARLLVNHYNNRRQQ